MGWEVGMKKWLRRIRGAIGMGLTWAAAWGGAGTLVMLGFLLVTGRRPDAPFPLMFGVFGFVAGIIFSGVLGLVEGRRRFDQMSLPRFAAWGAAGGFLLSAAFVLAVSLAGNPAFLWNLVVVGPAFAVAAAGSAAGSLALARRAQDRELLETTEDLTTVGLSDGEARKVLGNGH
jgi:peptidoglycan/LPS O-acetylase OafA/YrhL